MRANHKPPQLVDVLFGADRREILGLLLLRPDESFYVREIARLTGVPAGSLHRELNGAAQRLKREVNPVVMTKAVFAAKLAARDRFATRVAREPKIFLLGDASEFRELAQDRAA